MRVSKTSTRASEAGSNLTSLSASTCVVMRLRTISTERIANFIFASPRPLQSSAHAALHSCSRRTVTCIASFGCAAAVQRRQKSSRSLI
eukprot:3554725-Rhodomonas_salina.1